MVESDYYIRKLEASDTVQNFKVGNQSFLPLKTFLQKQAKQFQQSSIAQTYVAVTGDKTIIGFVTLTCSEIDLQIGYDLGDCSHANNYEFLPAVKIARLAVDNRYRANGIGSTLIDYAVALIQRQGSRKCLLSLCCDRCKKRSSQFLRKTGICFVGF